MSDLQSENEKAWGAVKPVEPDAPAPITDPDHAQSGGKTWGQAATDLAARAGKAVVGADEMEKSLLFWGTGGPYGAEPGSGPIGDMRKRILSPALEGQKKDILERSAHPQTNTGKILGGAVEGVTNMATLPIPGGIARNILMGMGMGEGSEVLKNALGGVFSYFSSDPRARAAGQSTG